MIDHDGIVEMWRRWMMTLYIDAQLDIRIDHKVVFYSTYKGGDHTLLSLSMSTYVHRDKLTSNL